MSQADQQGEWETSDLGTAAFAHMLGLKLLGSVKDPRGSFIFRFSDPEGRGPNYEVDYLNSECRRFDSAVRSLKKLCHSRPPSKVGRSR